MRTVKWKRRKFSGNGLQCWMNDHEDEVKALERMKKPMPEWKWVSRRYGAKKA